MENDLKTNRMLVNVVLDRSGSMQTGREGTISGYNEYINGLRDDKDSEYDISLIQFDAYGSTRGPALTISYLDKPLADVPELTAADYQPRGSTPLYDAIGECVRRVEAKGRAITTVIITDGEENASAEFTKDSIRALIDQKKTEGWTFVFIGAEIDSYAVGGALGVPMAATANYVKGLESQLYASMAGATRRRSASNASVGVRASVAHDFYTVGEKQAMGDNTNAVVTTTAGGTTGGGSAPAQQQGGIPSGSANFPPPVPAPPKVDRKKRDWATTTK